MELSRLSPETQKYISQMLDRRTRDGIFDLDVCREILEYGKEIKSDAIYGIGCYFIAEHYWRDRIEDKTMCYLTESTKCFLKEGMGEFLTRTYNMMGSVSDSEDNRVVALNYFYTGLQYAEKYGLTYERGMIDFNIGFVLFRMKRYVEAVEHYESSISFYRQSEDSFYRNYNIVLGMQHCGSCYLKLERYQEAYDLLDQIDEIRREQPDRDYPQVNITSFRAECAAARGDRQEFLKYVNEVLDIIRPEKGIGEEADNLESLVELLFNFQELDRLDELFQVLDGKELENSPMLFMSLYPWRSQSLLQRGRTDEYIRQTGMYFEVYERDRRNHKLGAARIMELQDELREVEKEQAKISAANRKLEAMAMYDSMTKLANRAKINEYMSQKLEEAWKNETLLGVELMDIDRFKTYNDTYGHLAGDECIKAVAGVLRKMKSHRVFCGRYGGDEFVVIYSEMTLEEIEQTAEKIRKRICDLQIPHKKSEQSDIVTVSQGIFARVPDNNTREWDFSSMADTMLYHAKHDGRNCCRIGTEFEQ